MAFLIRKKESVPDALRRIVKEQIDGSLVSLNGRSQTDRARSIHDTRKRMKKIRAILQLVRGELGAETFHAENSVFRDAARTLAEARQANVHLQMVDELLEDNPEPAERALLESLKRDLLRQHAGTQKEIDRKETLNQLHQEMESAVGRLAQWPLATDGWPALQEGLRRAYRRGRRGLRKAQEDADVRQLHDWRKSIKHLWYYARLLKPIWPPMLSALADELHRLEEMLGREHDLTLLRASLEEDDAYRERPEALEALLRHIDRRRAALHRSALRQGRRIYCEPANAFLRRLEAGWQAWRG